MVRTVAVACNDSVKKQWLFLMNSTQTDIGRQLILTKTFKLAALTLSSLLLTRLIFPRDSFAGKVVVITGGSRGLGLALARQLAHEKAKLAIIARDQQELIRAKSDLVKYGCSARAWVCDV